MKCQKCGAELNPSQKFCAFCGNKVQDATTTPHINTATLYITEEEAHTGCVKELNLPGFAAPMRFNLKPGMTDKRVLEVKNARYIDRDGNVTIKPLDVIIRVQPSSPRKAQRFPKKKVNGKVLVLTSFLIVALIVGVSYVTSNRDILSNPSESGVVFKDKSNQRYADKNQEEILNDAISEDSYFENYHLVPTNAKITKSWTSEDGKCEYVWLDLEAQNEDFKYDASYILEYVKYNEGWMLENCKRDNYDYLALKGADHSIAENYLEKCQKGKYSDATYTFVSSNLGDNEETIVYRISTIGNDVCSVDYEVSLELEFSMTGWRVSDFTQLSFTENWNILGKWELHNINVDIVVNIHAFDATYNTAVIDYSVLTYIDLEKYQKNPYAITTTRINPGQTYSSGKISVNLYQSPYDDNGGGRTYTVYDTENSEKAIFTIYFCGTECAFVNTNNEYDNETPNTGICVFLEGWGGRDGCAFWLSR